MLTLQNTEDASAVTIDLAEKPVRDLLSREWLLTNKRGGYASSTIIGCNTRGYHGLLVGSLNPPGNRIMALAACLEMVLIDGRLLPLSTFEFPDKFAPEGYARMKRFRRDAGVHFDYELDAVALTKSIYLARDSDTVALEYVFTKVERPIEFILRPFTGLRDFHSLQKSYAPLCSKWLGDGLLVRHDLPGSCELFLKCPGSAFEKDQQWWFNFAYRSDRRRGQDFTEDLWTPGFFKSRVEGACRIVLWANLSERCKPEQLKAADIGQLRDELNKRRKTLIRGVKGADGRLKTLYLAADEFLVERRTDHDVRTTVLAGYPWFADWGRDAFISLPGLLLVTGRFDEARSVLTTFAGAADKGMIPNCFDDRNGTAHFNSVDASLWFINAAFQYLQASTDSATFARELLPVIRWIVDCYHNGTEFDIHADEDGLITAGNNRTQLTWMDAKYDGIAFTSRCGKAVEVNALWYNSLCLLADYYADRDLETAGHYRAMSDKVGASFCKLFWNEKCSYLNDCILPDGEVDTSLRPNQIFAVSLPYSPLSAWQQKRVVEVIAEKLLTPYGLRTLPAGDARYKGSYTGPQYKRDEAYHQGTIWPFLLGAFVEAYLRVNGYNRKSKKKAQQFIQPLLRHLTEDGCIGSISEIFDGDTPHKPRGCIAQAWSVAELIRACRLVNGG